MKEWRKYMQIMKTIVRPRNLNCIIPINSFFFSTAKLRKWHKEEEEASFTTFQLVIIIIPFHLIQIF